MTETISKSHQCHSLFALSMLLMDNDQFLVQSHCFKHVNTLLSVSLTNLLQSFVFVSTCHHVLTMNHIRACNLLLDLGRSQLF